MSTDYLFVSGMYLYSHGKGFHLLPLTRKKRLKRRSLFPEKWKVRYRRMEKKKVQRSKMQNGSFPYDHFFDILSGKWKSCIMIAIDYNRCIHFNAFQKLWGISSKVLYTQLADLEKDGLIVRQKLDTDEKQTTQYVMTEKGKSVMPILKEIYIWAMRDESRTVQGLDISALQHQHAIFAGLIVHAAGLHHTGADRGKHSGQENPKPAEKEKYSDDTEEKEPSII